MTRILKSIAVPVLAATLLPACSWFGDKDPEYLHSSDGFPLKVPEGLDKPRVVAPVTIGVGDMRTPSGDELNPLPPRVTITAGGGDANAYLAWSASGAYLAVKDDMESVARRLGYAIQRSGMNLLEKSEQGAHRFEYHHARTPAEKGFFEKMAFWRDDMGPDYSGTYVVRLQPDGKETRVYLVTVQGTAVNTNAAEHVLGIFMERLG